MEELCPLCIKRGLKKKMKAIQINLEEAVWMCESEECIWPMDHKELEYIPRKVGETWACYWNTYKPQRSSVPVSQPKWDFITPPYTPRTEVSPTASSEASTHSNTDQNRLNGIYSKESNLSFKESTGCSKEPKLSFSEPTDSSTESKSLSSKDSKNLSSKEPMSLSSKESVSLSSKESASLSSKESESLSSKESVSLSSKESESLSTKELVSLSSKESMSLSSKESVSLFSKESTSFSSQESLSVFSKDATKLSSKQTTILSPNESTNVSSNQRSLSSNKSTNSPKQQNLSSNELTNSSKQTSPLNESANFSSKQTSLSSNESTALPLEESTSIPPQESISIPSKESASLLKEHNYNREENKEIKIEDSINPLLPKSELLTDITNPSILHPSSIDQVTKSSSTQNLNLENPQITSTIKTASAGVPTIVNMEKMKLVIIKDPSKIKNLSKHLIEKIQHSEPKNTILNLQKSIVKIENPVKEKPKLEIKTVNIKGLPPVTLTYEVPHCLNEVSNPLFKTSQISSLTNEPTKVDNSIAKTGPQVEAEKLNKTDTETSVKTLPKNVFMASKKYQKFDFSELRKLKNLKKSNETGSLENNLPDSKSDSKLDSESGTNPDSKPGTNPDSKPDTNPDSKSDLETASTSNQNSTADKVSKKNGLSEFADLNNFDTNFSPLSEDSKDNVISELDTFLNDFIEENKLNIPNICDDDEWLSSLLN